MANAAPLIHRLFARTTHFAFENMVKNARDPSKKYFRYFIILYYNYILMVNPCPSFCPYECRDVIELLLLES